MKAWCVSDRNGDIDVSFIVFAETRGKAIASVDDDGAFDWCKFTDLRATRVPQLDSYYKGGRQMEWCNDEDRVAMVRYAGFRCSDEVGMSLDECKECPAHEWCDRYESMMEEEI